MKRQLCDSQPDEEEEGEVLCKDVVFLILREWVDFCALMRMRSVSREWNLKIPKLITCIHLYPFREFSRGGDELGIKFGKFINLRSLTMKYSPTDAEFYKMRLDKVARHVQLLSIYGLANQWKPEPQSKFINLVALHLRDTYKLKNLKSLIPLSGTLRVLSLDNATFDSFVELGKLTNLEVFSFQESESGFTEENLGVAREFDEAVCCLVKLKSLRIYWCYTNCIYLGKLHQLEFLDLLLTKVIHRTLMPDLAKFIGECFSDLKHLRQFALPRWTRHTPEIYEALEKLPSLLCLFTNKIVPIQNLKQLQYYRFRYEAGDEKKSIIPPKSLKCVTISLKMNPLPDINSLRSMYTLFANLKLPIISFFPSQFQMDFCLFLSRTFPSFSPKDWVTFRYHELYYFDLHHECSYDFFSLITNFDG